MEIIIEKCQQCLSPLLRDCGGTLLFGCGSTLDGDHGWRHSLRCETARVVLCEPGPLPVDHPRMKTVKCPECSCEFERPVVIYDSREVMADRGCLCDACESKRSAAVQAVSERERHLALWKARVPEDYHRADAEKVHSSMARALDWIPASGCRRLGIHGAPGCGKSMAMAATLRGMGMPFSWTNGFAIRSIYNQAVSGTDDERIEAGKRWRRFRSTPLLVLDDVDKGNFTEAWAGALFDLLEHRNSSCLATAWTSNLGPGQIAKKIALKSFDEEQAQAIERRLCDGALLIHASK